MTYFLNSGNELTISQLDALVAEFAADEARWRPQLRFDADERFCLLLHTDASVDIWLLSWLAGQHTTLHDHGGSRAAIQVVQGELHELHAGPGGELYEHRLKPQSRHLLAPDAIHDVVNSAGPPAASIHGYSPPLRQMTYYERDRVGFRPTRTIATRHPEPA
jgi:predicted metal-dependent enzyme (double-stranded beta helix superfamily)